MDFKQWLLKEMAVKFGYSKHPKISDSERKKSSVLDPIGFHPADQKAIQNEKLRTTIENRLDASTGKNWNILFIEFPVARNSESVYRKYVKNYCDQNGIDTENSITFAKNSTSGDILTPWMVLHTIGHAITDDGIVITKAEKDFADLNDAIENYNDISNKSHHKLFDKFGDLPPHIRKTFLGRSGRIETEKTTSFYDNKKYDPIPNYEEYQREIIAGYLWSKKIMLQPKPGKEKEIKIIEESLKNIINNLVGTIIVDFFD